MRNIFTDPADIDRLRFVLTGPNTDFDFYVAETVGDNAFPLGGGLWGYKFEARLPVDAMGSYTVSPEGRNYQDINMGSKVENERTGLESSLLAFAVTDATAQPRRMIVDDAKCESCHANDDFAIHGDDAG